jgi:DNA primase
VLALDPDPAGQAAAARTALAALAEITQSRGREPGAAAALDLRIARLPEGRGDPDELIQRYPDLWNQALDDSMPAFDFYFDQTLSTLDRSSTSWRQEAVDKLLPLIQQFAGTAGFQGTWLQRLAQETGLDPSLLQRSVPGARSTRRRQSSNERAEQVRSTVSGTTSRGLTIDPTANVEQALMALLLQIVVLPNEAAERLEAVELERLEHRVILDQLLAWRGNGNYDYDMFRETLPPEFVPHADALREIQVPLPEDDKLSVAIDYHLARMQHFRIQNRHMRASQLLNDVSADDRGALLASLADLMSQRQQLERSLDRLSQLVLQAPSVARGRELSD